MSSIRRSACRSGWKPGRNSRREPGLEVSTGAVVAPHRLGLPPRGQPGRGYAPASPRRFLAPFSRLIAWDSSTVYRDLSSSSPESCRAQSSRPSSGRGVRNKNVVGRQQVFNILDRVVQQRIRQRAAASSRHAYATSAISDVEQLLHESGITDLRLHPEQSRQRPAYRTTHCRHDVPDW